MSTSTAELAPGDPAPVIHVGGPARELMRALTLRFFRYIHTRRAAYTINVMGKRLSVAPGVFTPRYRGLISLKASELLAANLRVPAGARVLDVGTGTGIQGIFAAGRASHVVATDINPEAVRCARLNARLNGVRNLEARCGDLFEPVRGERFDFVVWLPPSFFFEPRTPAEWAFMCGRDGGLLRRFCEGVGDHLAPGGVIQFSCIDRTHQFLLPLLDREGFRLEQILEVRRLPMETVRQYLATRR